MAEVNNEAINLPGVSNLSNKSKSHVFFPNLDGLRFFCFISVFFYHSYSTSYSYISDSPVYLFIKKGIFVNGNLGVNFFFVLSGFLITFLLLKEKQVTGKIHVPNFYVRRILRIWPLFYFCVFFGFVIFPILKQFFGQVPDEPARPIFYIFFLNNFDFIKNFPDSSVLSVLWSVAVEEQFYLTWPLLLAFTPAKYYKYLFAIIIIGSFIFRFFNYSNGVVLEVHTLSCISDMAMGGLAAYLAFNENSWLRRKVKNFNRGTIIFIYIVSACLYFFRKKIFYTVFSPFIVPFDRLFISVFFALIILEQCFSDNSFYKMGNYKLVSKLGQYTYGLYCLHMIGILITIVLLGKLHFYNKLWEVIIVEGGMSLLITVAIAYTSYTFYESKFLKLKDRFAFITKR